MIDKNNPYYKLGVGLRKLYENKEKRVELWGEDFKETKPKGED